MTPDPIELQILRNLFEAAAEQMGLTLARVAFSANIKERRDFSCALFDPDGHLLAQAAHIPVHLGSMPASVAAVRRRLGSLAPGDVAVVNDPFEGGTHLPDITLVSAIFVDQDGRSALAGYVANRAHHADVGGVSPGSMTLSTHIDQEGLRLEPTLLLCRGERVESCWARILSAVRTPAERTGDLEAQLAANAVGERAVARIVATRGLDVVRRYGLALQDYAETFMRRTIAAIPDGVYRFSDRMDGHATGPHATGPHAIGEPTSDPSAFGPVIDLVLTVSGEKLIADFSGSSPQVESCVNCPAAVTASAVYYALSCLMADTVEDGSDVPLNGGAFRPIDVRSRPGTIVHAVWPAPVVAGNTETSQRVVDVVFGALAQALPGVIPAASCGSMNSLALGSSAVGASGATQWTYYETIGGGCGASAGGPGASAIQCHMTNTLNTPAEALELQYPLRVRRFERASDTGGVGRFCGGDGIVREIEALDDCELTLLADRRTSKPYGLQGGGPGTAGRQAIRLADGSERPLSGRDAARLKAGDRIVVQTPGGGGWGVSGGNAECRMTSDE